MQEEWLPIDEFPGYSVSNYGFVHSTNTERVLKNSPVQYNMPTVGMSIDGKQHRRSVAGLVARAFLPDPEADHFDTPIHLDGDRSNCRVDNLAWRPRWFAINYHIERRSSPLPPWSRDIRLLDTGEVFSSPAEAAQKYGLLEVDINRSLVMGYDVFPHGFTFIFDVD